MTVHALNSYWHADYPDLRAVGPRFGAWMDHGTLRLITPATSQPVTTADMRAQVRLDQTDEDALLDAYVAAATQTIEDETGRALMPQTWQVEFDEWLPAEVVLPIAPVASIVSVGSRSASGVEATLSSASWQAVLPSGPTCGRGRLRLLAGASAPGIWAAGSVATIRFVAGYADAASVPAPLKAAVRMLAADLFETREATAAGAARALTENPTHGRLLAPYRLIGRGY